MKRLLGATVTIALAAVLALPAIAADLPEVKVSATNAVPACATPGRLMAYVRMRNPNVSDRFDGVATEYMRHGEELGIRWDMAFFQMILETGALSYTGDVRADQNNFAGLGAAGRGKHGERFADISSGVKAHLQHLLMYAGEHIDDPVADRTRKVQEWGVLTDWQSSISGPMTFSLIAQQWAPGARTYSSDIATISEGFYNSVCNAPDPRPELVQEARKGREPKPDTQVAAAATEAGTDADAATTAVAEPLPGAQIAQRTIEEERNEDRQRAALGAPSVMLDAVAETAKPAAEQKAATAPPPAQGSAAVTLINPTNPTAATATKDATETKADANPTATETKADGSPAVAETKADGGEGAKGADIQTASVAGAAATQLKLPPPAKSTTTCKVWTASYGGQRAVLIRATTQGTVNYTVLDVNETSEKREVDAYIAAYAKGGERVGAFANQTQALDKAFELCPEG